MGEFVRIGGFANCGFDAGGGWVLLDWGNLGCGLWLVNVFVKASVDMSFFHHCDCLGVFVLQRMIA